MQGMQFSSLTLFPLMSVCKRNCYSREVNAENKYILSTGFDNGTTYGFCDFMHIAHSRYHKLGSNSRPSVYFYGFSLNHRD